MSVRKGEQRKKKIETWIIDQETTRAQKPLFMLQHTHRGWPRHYQPCQGEMAELLNPN